MSETIKVDVWSDIACPWCFIGKRKFAEGVRRFTEGAGEGAPRVEVEYHSFELAPDTPVDFEGSEVDFLAEYKGMPEAQVHQMLDQVTQIAASVGLAYRFDKVRHTKTLKAHQLLADSERAQGNTEGADQAADDAVGNTLVTTRTTPRWMYEQAKARGLQLEMTERLFRAYFEEGRHVGHDTELAELAAEVGLDRDEVLAALAEERFAEDVAADIAQARAYGITGVPFYVLDGRYGVSGAQDPEVFANALRQVAADRAEVSA